VKTSPSLSSLRAGVIGTGFIGPVHVEALRRLGVTVTANCDVGDLAAQAAARLKIPRAFADHRQLAACPEVDVVHITAPNRFHCQMSLAALRAGKHVVCEKPLAMNTRETARVVEAARAARRVFAVNYNVRFYPAVLQLRRLVRQGILGDIIHVNGSYLQDWLFKDTDYNWRLLPAEGGRLRAVADIGTHWMDTVSFILGARITSVFADLATWHKQRRRPLGDGTDFCPGDTASGTPRTKSRPMIFGSILLRFSNGARGNLAGRRWPPDARTAFASRSTARKSPPGGAPKRPNSFISAIATPPTKPPCAPPRHSGTAPRVSWTIPPAMSKGSPTRSK
jgi:predicted dehydrogenase